jgi:hypothetical protein
MVIGSVSDVLHPMTTCKMLKAMSRTMSPMMAFPNHAGFWKLVMI